MPSIGQIARALDTDVSHFWGKERPGTTQKTNPPPVTEATYPFEPIVGHARTQSASTQHEMMQMQSRAPLATCIRSSLKWSWQAGPSRLLAKIGTSVTLALLPYAATMSGAELVDSLSKISSDPSAVSSTLLWFGVATAILIGSTGAAIVNRGASMVQGSKEEVLMHSALREAATNFSPAERRNPRIKALLDQMMRNQYYLQDFGNRLFEMIVPTTSIAGAAAIIIGYSPAAFGGMLLFCGLELYHAFKSGQDRLRVHAELTEAYKIFGAQDWRMTDDGYIDLQINGRTEQYLKHLHQEQCKINEVRLGPDLRSLTKDAWVKPLNVAFISGVSFVMLSDAINGFMHGGSPGMTIGTWGMLSGAVVSLNSALKSFSQSLGWLIRSAPLARVAHGIIQEGCSRRCDREARIAGSNYSMPTGPVEIKINNLTYRHNPDGPDVLKTVSLTIERGEFVAIVGASSDGKSTLLDLLGGVAVVPENTIRIDGTDVNDIPTKYLWDMCAYARQNAGLFQSTTIRTSLSIGADKVLSDDNIREAATITGFWQLMKRTRMSLDSVIGPGFTDSTKLSGGAGTLLILTRALLRPSDYLLLDEPTSALDPSTAQAVCEAICASRNTRVVVTHDPALAMRAHRIAVFVQGRLFAIGTHEELMETCPEYQKLFDQQVARLTPDPQTAQ